MSRTNRTKRSSEARSGGKGPSKRNDRTKTPSRWPWIFLCLVGIFLVVSTGVSSSKPTGQGLLVNITISTARGISSVFGSFGIALCFLLILHALVKIANPGSPLPRFVWGLWTLLIFLSAIYHDIKAPWEDTFPFAKTGGGGGIVGASVGWFFRASLGRVPTFVALGLGTAVGLSLVANKTAYAPFSYIWMCAISLWQWLVRFTVHFFRPQGPSPEEIHPEFRRGLEEEPGGDIGLSALLETGVENEESIPETGLARTVAELKKRLSASQEQEGNRAQEDASDAAKDFEPLLQPPLNESLFYEFPSPAILQKSDPQKRQRLPQDLEVRARIIEKTLLSFGVVAKVVNYTRGPTVTQFELLPGPGVKIASIVNLAQDLALALAARDVRMEAPIPGKSAVGIEVPNKQISLVHLRDVLETREFKVSKSPLTVALGKDISGRSVLTSLDGCLHLLIAGATGAGKSMCINSLIASILFKARPDQVKLVLIDPKRVELSVWSKIPHLIAPVVSDPKKAAGALRWAIKEMESRYEKFANVGTRDIERYNLVATPPDSPKPAMPYIVIIIDELSDLMMVAPAEVEDSIFRLAQMARAAGIFLVVATQRPSVNVITGTIKANIPSRIAFAVASQIDSRTILDAAGAEKLLGRGDMLFYPVGTSKPLRAQGCYLSEREIDELVSFVSSQAKPQFAPGVLSQPESARRETAMQEDPFFSQALRIVVEAKQASVSLLQRKLPIGYSRAARLVDAMEVKGYVGPYEGSKPREVRLSIGEYMRLFESGAKETAAGTTSPDIRKEPHASEPKENGGEDYLQKPSFLGKRDDDSLQKLLKRAQASDKKEPHRAK